MIQRFDRFDDADLFVLKCALDDLLESSVAEIKMNPNKPKYIKAILGLLIEVETAIDKLESAKGVMG